MASLIPKTNATVGSVTPPTAGVLATGEVAENKYTGRTYMKREDGTVVDSALVRLAGDLSGTTQVPTSNTDQGTVSAQVVAFNGHALTTVAPAVMQSPVYTSNGLFEYQAAGIAGFPVSNASLTAGDILVFTLETDGVQRWKPTHVPLIKASCQFAGDYASRTTKTATYARSGTTITVTSTSHGFLVGHRVWLNFTSGTATDKIFTIVTAPDADTFTVTDTSSGTTSGNVEYYFCPLTAAIGINSVIYSGTSADTGAYLVNMNAGITWSCRDVQPSAYDYAGSANGISQVYMDYGYNNSATAIPLLPSALSWGFMCHGNDETADYQDCGLYSSLMVL